MLCTIHTFTTSLTTSWSCFKVKNCILLSYSGLYCLWDSLIPKVARLSSKAINIISSKTQILPLSESECCSVVSDSLRPHGLYSPWNSAGQNVGVGSLCLLQGIFPTQRSNSGPLHCRRILYQLSHNGRPLSERGKAIPIIITKRFEGNLIVFYSL